jgi:hypothetical protein
MASTLHQDVTPSPVLSHRPPEVMALCLDGEEHFIEMPLIAWLRAPAPPSIGVLLPPRAAPRADGLVGHEHPPDEQEVLDLAGAEAEPVVRPDAMTDELDREAVVLVAVGRGERIHAASRPHGKGSQQVDKARCIHACLPRSSA